jgi:hypothetical protein
MYPCPLYSHVLEEVTKNWAAFREDPLIEARAWSRHVSHICIPAPTTPTYWRESPRTGPPLGRTPSQRPGPGPGVYPIYVSPLPSTPTYWRKSPRTGPPSGRTPHRGQGLVQVCIPYMYPPSPLLPRLGGSPKNWAAFREDPLTEARAWSRRVSHICIPAPTTPTYWRESPRTGPPSVSVKNSSSFAEVKLDVKF